tara:strand:- start:403 stop:1311 length:909 start_codon:yes stop_codon:yes gene_type:complete
MRNIYLYLKSSSATLDPDSRFHRFDLINPIIAKHDELINIRLVEAEIPISYYNITSSNNYFRVEFAFSPGSGSGVFEHTVPIGNYSATELLAELNTIADVTVLGRDFRIVTLFDSKTSKYNFTISKVSGILVSITEIAFFTNVLYTNYINKAVGVVPITLVTTGESVTFVAQNVCSLGGTRNIYIESDKVFETRNFIGEKTNIVGKVQMSGGAFSIVYYQNKTNQPIQYERKNKYLDHINLRLVGENREESIDFNGSEFTLAFLFTFTKDKMLLGDEIEEENVNQQVHKIPLLPQDMFDEEL